MTQNFDSLQRTFFRVLLNRYHGKNFSEALKLLPTEKAQEILHETTSASDPSKALYDASEVLQQVHYSWLAPLLKSKPALFQPFYLSTLSEEQKKGLTKFLDLPKGLENSSHPLKKYLSHLLYVEFGLNQLLPIGFLPSSPFLRLLSLKKSTLVELIDFLGLYDLSEEIRNIVDTKNLKNIYSCLTAKKQQFLRICLHQKERITLPKLNLEKWDGNCSELAKMLHKRGIIRLGKALSGQNPDLISYLTYILDVGRGTLLKKEIEKQEIPTVSQALTTQVFNVLNFLEKEKS